MKTTNFSKWSDSQFKKIFIVFLLLATIPAILLITLTRPMEDKYRSLMETKQVFILDPSGQRYLVSALDTQEKTFEILGRLFVKKMFTFDFTGSAENLEFIKQYTSTKLFKRLLMETEGLREETVQTTGTYKVDITKYHITRTGNEYQMDVFFDHTLVSKAISSKKPYAVRIKLINSSDTYDNYSGVYMADYILYVGDDLTDLLSEYKED